jgi:hypothetical protein
MVSNREAESLSCLPLPSENQALHPRMRLEEGLPDAVHRAVQHENEQPLHPDLPLQVRQRKAEDVRCEFYMEAATIETPTVPNTLPLPLLSVPIKSGSPRIPLTAIESLRACHSNPSSL